MTRLGNRHAASGMLPLAHSSTPTQDSRQGFSSTAFSVSFAQKSSQEIGDRNVFLPFVKTKSTLLFFSAVVVLHWNGSAAMMVGLIFENLDLLLYLCVKIWSNADAEQCRVSSYLCTTLLDPAILCMYILFGIWITLNYIGGWSPMHFRYVS